ncbi:polyprenyl synthetase family protein [Nitratidesulfovibrio sp. SRB-5]|uniref:polyprenyl synthetase family protein n=1 Tax=Nitratidesulfovibrio sp. SRB-5 TaxID=2872636 RepID=UPI0010279C2A|nr:farnesyl diphosphate synthase [Nitratidesulfovibrio sp. SRB-5]MBZ2171514.1 polyprenyl synthetase family protein [Nitratidesulfovibrio sp. SRB-5]RXF76230.1 polyprenyl synthetase family protein [Desulfovibrio sp. DS-1]
MLTPSEIKTRLRDAAAGVERYLAACLADRGIPARLRASMEYSLNAGGKRVRPVLCLTTAALFGLPTERVMPFAAAIEMIHTYSLIHDDLPAMDDDDLRRGKPSNHKMFDEATAILAGDGLLTDAFDFMAGVGAGVAAAAGDENGGNAAIPAANVLAALRAVARAAGASGMVGGQGLDMEYTGRTGVTLEEMAAMHAMKTGALLRASCLSGALLAGADADAQARIADYGAHIGAAFQIVDDILDEVGDEAEIGKPVGSDAEQGKTTYPSLLGVERSRALAHERADAAIERLSPYTGPDADFLRSLASYIVDRAS